MGYSIGKWVDEGGTGQYNLLEVEPDDQTKRRGDNNDRSVAKRCAWWLMADKKDQIQGRAADHAHPVGSHLVRIPNSAGSLFGGGQACVAEA